MRGQVPTAVHDWLATHLSMIACERALDLGMIERNIRTQLTQGHWLRHEANVYRAANGPRTFLQDVYAAQLATGGRAVACGETALAVHGLTDVPAAGTLQGASLPTVVVMSAFAPALRHVHVRRTRILAAGDVVRIGLVRSTTLPRTGIDLAGGYDVWEMLAFLDRAEAARPGTVARTHRRAVALRRGRPGVAGLARLTAPDFVREFRSWLERYGALVFDLGGLPPPAWNHRVYSGGHLLGVADAFWSRPAVAELDGAAFHSSPAQRAQDRARDRRFLKAGIPPFRYSYTELLEDPQAVVDELAEVLGCQARVLDVVALGSHPLRRLL